MRLGPRFVRTDLFGALLLAGEVFEQTPASQKTLVIFSDMRHNASGIDLESPAIVPRYSSIVNSDKKPGVANLKGVRVFALGVDDAGKSLTYWKTLHAFWAEYLRAIGGELKTYSPLRDLEVPSSQEP